MDRKCVTFTKLFKSDVGNFYESKKDPFVSLRKQLKKDDHVYFIQIRLVLSWIPTVNTKILKMIDVWP